MILGDHDASKMCRELAPRHGGGCVCDVIRATERAVLERLREPTLDMLRAAYLAEQTADPDDNPHLVTWRAMIDAAAKGDA